MKITRFYLIILMLFSPLAYAGQVICPGENNTVKSYNHSTQPTEGCLWIDPVDQSVDMLFKNLTNTYIKLVDGIPTEMSQEEKDTISAAREQIKETNLITTSKDELMNMRTLKCVVIGIVDQFNVLHERDRDIAVNVANATSLADLKAKWSALSTLNNISYEQAKRSIEGCIDNNTSWS